jgi:hypothetical protein
MCYGLDNKEDVSCIGFYKDKWYRFDEKIGYDLFCEHANYNKEIGDIPYTTVLEIAPS